MICVKYSTAFNFFSFLLYFFFFFFFGVYTWPVSCSCQRFFLFQSVILSFFLLLLWSLFLLLFLLFLLSFSLLPLVLLRIYFNRFYSSYKSAECLRSTLAELFPDEVHWKWPWTLLRTDPRMLGDVLQSVMFPFLLLCNILT